MRGFWSIYAACLGACLLAVQVALARVDPPPAPPADEVAAALVARPPKPEGVRAPAEGEGPRYTEAACRAYGGDIRDACFGALALQRAERDPVGGLAACEAIEAPALRWECAGDVAGLHWSVDRGAAEAICEAIPRRKWRDQCWFNLALAASQVDPDYARSRCGRAGMWRDFCYHDVNGEIAQVDPVAALAWCDLEQGALLRRKTCYHGLGKYLGRSDPEAAWHICQQVPTREPLYRENCHHGIGWALAETRGASALADCARSGAYRDSCILGVSAYVKRLDPGEALALCEEVRGASLRERCEAFATR